MIDTNQLHRQLKLATQHQLNLHMTQALGNISTLALYRQQLREATNSINDIIALLTLASKDVPKGVPTP